MLRNAAVLLAVATVGGLALKGLVFGLSALSSGVLMTGSWALSAWLVGSAADQGRGGLAVTVMLLKLPILGGALWMLLSHGDVLGVVVGGSVVMIAAGFAAIDPRAHAAPEEA